MKIPSICFSNEERVAMAAQCRDCDVVPKVADAGMVFEDSEGQRVQIMHNGLRVVADGYYGQWMTDLIRLCRGHHECQEERLFHEVMKVMPPDARMIELGGFWSYYSLWFLMNHPERASVVIEPEPSHLEIGRRNAAINRLEPAFRHGFAAANFAQKVPFACEVAGELELTGYSVPHLMEEQGWQHLNLLHADIQGAETEMLESCRDLFRAGRIDWIFVSTHSHHISRDPLTHQRCLAILRECGAVIEAEHDVHESFSGDGLIVARFCAAPSNWSPIEISSNRASRALFRHLAYDLQEIRDEADWLKHVLTTRPEPKPIHPSLRDGGGVLHLTEDGPLGSAGDAILLPQDEVMSPAVRENAAWDFDSVMAFAERVPTNKRFTLVDIGANVGLFTRQVANLVPAIDTILCVEPDRHNFAALRYNLTALGARASAFNVALGQRDGEFEFFRDRENMGNYSLNPDAVRRRPHEVVKVQVREAGEWLSRQLEGADAILWKSDTQGSDELIVALTPWDIWERVEVALLEMWRIAKPDYDRDAFRERLESFPNRRLGARDGVTVSEILDYLSADDWKFEDLLLWR